MAESLLVLFSRLLREEDCPFATGGGDGLSSWLACLALANVADRLGDVGRLSLHRRAEGWLAVSRDDCRVVGLAATGGGGVDDSFAPSCGKGRLRRALPVP